MTRVPLAAHVLRKLGASQVDDCQRKCRPGETASDLADQRVERFALFREGGNAIAWIAAGLFENPAFIVG